MRGAAPDTALVLRLESQLEAIELLPEEAVPAEATGPDLRERVRERERDRERERERER